MARLLPRVTRQLPVVVDLIRRAADKSGCFLDDVVEPLRHIERNGYCTVWIGVGFTHDLALGRVFFYDDRVLLVHRSVLGESLTMMLADPDMFQSAVSTFLLWREFDKV